MFILFIFHICHIYSQIITLNIKGYTFDIPELEISFPNEKLSDSYYLNTYLSHSIFTISEFKLISRNIKQRYIALKLDETYHSSLYTSDIMINNILIPNISMYSTQSLGWFRDKGIALGYHYQDETFSIIHQLYKHKHIAHLQFAFHNIIYQLKGNFFIGGIPNDDHLNYHYKAEIKINEALPTWGFKLSGVKYNNNEYELNTHCIISTGMLNMINSDVLFETMVGNIINTSSCQLKYNRMTSYSQRLLQCGRLNNSDEIIELILNDKVQIQMKVGDFFSQSYDSLFASNNALRPIHNFSECIIGPGFINKFNYSIFDYEKKQIELYSDSYIITTKKVSSSYYLFIIIYINIILCLGNILLIILYKLIIKT